MHFFTRFLGLLLSWTALAAGNSAVTDEANRYVELVRIQLKEILERSGPALEEARCYLLLGQLLNQNADKLNAYEMGRVAAQKALAEQPTSEEALLLMIAYDGELAGLKKNLWSLMIIPRLEGQLLKLSQQNPELHSAAPDRALGYIYFKAPRFISVGSLEKAEEYLKRAFQRFPDHPENRLAYAEYVLAQGRGRQAQDLLGDVKFRERLKTATPESYLYRQRLALLESALLQEQP